MNMSKEAYERLLMDVTEFDKEDVITTSGTTPGGGGSGGSTDPLSSYELVYEYEQKSI